MHILTNETAVTGDVWVYCESWGGCACDYAKLEITSGRRAASEAEKSGSVSLAPETLSPLSPGCSLQHLTVTEFSLFSN